MRAATSSMLMRRPLSLDLPNGRRQAIPEPASLLLPALGGLFAVRRRWPNGNERSTARPACNAAGRSVFARKKDSLRAQRSKHGARTAMSIGRRIYSLFS